MNTALDWLAAVAMHMANNAYREHDGGLINYLLKNFNISSDAQLPLYRVTTHVHEIVTSQGFFFVVLCGLCWATLLMLLSVLLMCLHCARNGSSKVALTYRKIGWKFQDFRRKHRGQHLLKKGFLSGVQLVIYSLLTILCIAPLAMTYVTNNHLHQLISHATVETGLPGVPIFHQLEQAISSGAKFITEFAPHAREASKPVIRETIRRTDKMTSESINEFKTELMGSLGVTKLFSITNVLVSRVTTTYSGYHNITENSNQNFDFFTPIEYIKFKPRMLNSDLKLASDEIMSKLIAFCAKNLLNDCTYFKIALQNVQVPNIIDEKGPILQVRDNGKSFINSLKAAGQSPHDIRLQIAEGKQRSEQMVEEMKRKFAEDMNVTRFVSNMVNSNWDDVDSSMLELSLKIQNFSEVMSTDIHQKVVIYEGLRHSIFLTFLIFVSIMLFFSVFVILRFLLPIQGADTNTRHLLKNCNLAFFFIIALNVILTTVIFVTSGYLETQVCRYVKQKPGEKFNGTKSPLVIDRVLNNFINRNWDNVMMNMNIPLPLPKPSNIFLGLRSTCRENGPILQAINAIDGFDAGSMMDKGMSVSTLMSKGRGLMHQALGNINPRTMIPDSIVQDMEKLKQGAQYFIESNDYQAGIREMNSKFKYQDIFNLHKNWTNISSQLMTYKPNNYETGLIESMTREIQRAMMVIKNLQKAIKFIESTLKTLVDNQEITPLVNSTLIALDHVMQKTLNKTGMLELGDKLYTYLVEEKTGLKAAELIKYTVTEILKVIGPCKPLYDALEHVVLAGCVTALRPLAASSISLGWLLFLSTALLLGLLFLLAKKGNDEGEEIQENDANDADGHPLLKLNGKVKDADAPENGSPPVSNDSV